MPSSPQNAALFLASIMLAAIATDAAAQQQLPRPTPALRTAQAQTAPTEPQRTTATYADWVVQCETQTGPPQQKICEMAQVAQVQVQGRNTPFSRIAVAHPAKGQPVKLIVQLPVNASFNKTVHIQTSDTDPGIAAPFARCTPNGCFADFELKDDVLKKFRAASGGGKFTFADASGHDVTVPLSFNGFNQAFEALTKE